MARDTSARPHELLDWRLKDIEIKRTQDGELYVPLDVGRRGKKKSRPVQMKSSIKYYQAWLKVHTAASNSESYLFISMETGARYHNTAISVDSLRKDMHKLQRQHLPSLLKRPDVQKEDKGKIANSLLKRKFTPYVLRHSSISIYARNPNINYYTLRQHAGWTKSSAMVEIYIHEL